MNPLLIEGTRLLAPTLVAAAKSIPAAQLARFGLLRGPLIGLGPVALGVFGGAALTALMIPESRHWITRQAALLFKRVEMRPAEMRPAQS